MPIDVDLIKGITFDLFNTLMGLKGPRIDSKGISDYLLSQGVEIYPQELEAARQYVFFHDMPKYGINNWEDWGRHILKRLDYEVEDDILQGFVEKLGANDRNLYLFDDVVEIIEELAKRFILSIVTTIPEFQFNYVIEPIRKHFKIIVTGQNSGVAKGNPKIYSFDLKEKGVEVHNNIFVGDDPLYDIHYPKTLGMQTIEIARDGIFKSDEADEKITSLKDLLKLISN